MLFEIVSGRFLFSFRILLLSDITHEIVVHDLLHWLYKLIVGETEVICYRGLYITVISVVFTYL